MDAGRGSEGYGGGGIDWGVGDMICAGREEMDEL